MKIKLVFVSIVLLLFFPIMNIAQQISLKVLIAKGEIHIGLESAWRPVMASQKLLANEKIKISDGGFLVLIDENKNKSIELKNRGIYKVSDIAGKIASSGSGIFSKFIQLIEKELFTSKDSDTFVPGAVSRSSSAIKIAVPESSKVFAENIRLKWFSFDNDMTYRLTVSDRFGKLIFEKELQDTVFNFSYNIYNVKSEEYYFWKIASSNNPQIKSDDSYFYILDNKSKKAIKDSVALLLSQFQCDSNSVFDKWVLANFFRSNSLNYDALENYELIAQSPYFIEEFKNNFLQFLIKVSMLDTADLIKHSHQ